MSLVRRIARPLLAATFISGGISTLRNPGPRVPAADRIVGPLVDRVPQLSNTEQVVKIDAAVKVVAGALLATGRLPRLSATALVASIIPTTAAGHAFWQEEDATKRTQQKLHFYKNAGLLGGLLLAAVDTEGRPSLGWWARRAPAIVSHTATGLRKDSELALLAAGHTLRDKLPV